MAMMEMEGEITHRLEKDRPVFIDLEQLRDVLHNELELQAALRHQRASYFDRDLEYCELNPMPRTMRTDPEVGRESQEVPINDGDLILRYKLLTKAVVYPESIRDDGRIVQALENDPVLVDIKELKSDMGSLSPGLIDFKRGRENTVMIQVMRAYPDYYENLFHTATPTDSAD